MEKITKRYTYNGKPEISVDSEINGISCSNFCTKCGKADCEDIRKALFKLAEYEDIGLTPEQLREIDKLYAEKCNELADAKLPCAVGDTVYFRYDGIKIAPMRVEQIIIAKYGTALLLEYCGDDEQLKHWKINIESTALDCKIVSLTKEEAEAALKEAERRKEENETD